MRRRFLLCHVTALFLSLAFSVGRAFSQDVHATGDRGILSVPAMEYPRLAKELKLKGVVKLLVIVAADGHVIRTEVLGGSPVFVPIAVNALIKSKWQPGPRETKETLEVKFQPTKE